MVTKKTKKPSKSAKKQKKKVLRQCFVSQDTETSYKQEDTSPEQYQKLHFQLSTNARKRRIPVELISSDDDIMEELPPSAPSKSKDNLQIISTIKVNCEESSDDGNTSEVATSQEPSEKTESVVASCSEDDSSSDEEDWIPDVCNKFFPYKVEEKSDGSEDDSDEEGKEVPASQDASKKKIELKKEESDDESGENEEENERIRKVHLSVFENKKTVETNDSIEEESDPAKEIVVPVTRLTSNMKEDWDEKNHHKVKEGAERFFGSQVNNNDSGDEMSNIKCHERFFDSIFDDGRSGENKYKKEIICYSCKQLGHMFKDCHIKKSGKGKMTCFNCNEIGHMSRECPKKKTEGACMVCSNCNVTAIMPTRCPSRDCPESGSYSYMTHSLFDRYKDFSDPNEEFNHTDFFTGKEKGRILRDLPQKKAEEAVVGTTKFTSKIRDDDWDKSNNEFRFKVKKCAKRFYDSIFGNDSGPSERKFKKDKNCFRCNQPGHMFKDCQTTKSGRGNDKICFKCSEIGHMSRECPKKMSFEDGKRCFKCNEIGHMSRECPKKTYFEGSTRCFKCNEIGHMSRECPKKTCFEGGTRCFKCNEIGHTSGERPKKTSFEGGTSCFKCNEIGHMSRECPKKTSFEGGTKCFKCNEIGHISRDCLKKTSFEGGTRCYKCNEIGHISNECQMYRSTSTSSHVCSNCNEAGHMPKECPTKKFSGCGTICYNCTGIGHTYRECPSKSGVRGNDLRRQITGNRRNEVSQTTNVCNVPNMKCFGSTIDQHCGNSSEQSERFKHIDCFICKEMGHMSRDCPQKNVGGFRGGFGCEGGNDRYEKRRRFF